MNVIGGSKVGIQPSPLVRELGWVPTSLPPLVRELGWVPTSLPPLARELGWVPTSLPPLVRELGWVPTSLPPLARGGSKVGVLNLAHVEQHSMAAT